MSSPYTLNTAYGTNGILVSGDTATFEVEGGLVETPEPSIYVLMGVGLLALVLISKRDRLKNQ